MDICITGAAQNTLRNINLVLPAGKITVLVGPSGSGKSTLAYDTLFAESRRRFLDCLSPARAACWPDRTNRKCRASKACPLPFAWSSTCPPGRHAPCWALSPR